MLCFPAPAWRSVATSGYRVIKGIENNNGREVAKGLTAGAAGYASGVGGAEVGAVALSWLGPIGMLTGGIVGGIGAE